MATSLFMTSLSSNTPFLRTDGAKLGPVWVLLRTAVMTRFSKCI